MKLKFILILFLGVLIAACDKRTYPPDKTKLEKEDIYFNGFAGEEPINLSIGTEGYYCYSSYEQTPDSVYVFEGELRKYDCNPCPRAFRVQLSDYRLRVPGAAVLPDSSLAKGNRAIIPGISKPHTIKFSSHSNKQISSVKWQFDNGLSSNDPEVNCEFTQAGVQTVSLTVRTTGNCESTVINKVYIGGSGGYFACGISSAVLQNNTSQFQANIIGGKAPFTCTWNFGDGKTEISDSPSHQYQYAGSYPVKLVVRDAENKVCESNFIHVAGNDISSCSVNMSLTHKSSRNAFLNGVKLQWTDQSNTIFRSDSISQPAESYFEIIKSEPYEPNERSEAGRLLTLRFNVLLSDGNRKLWFKSESAVIAVAYK